VITSHGLDLLDVYTGAEGVLTGSARLIQEQKERSAKVLRDQEAQRKQAELDRKRAALDAQIAALQAAYEAEHAQAMREISIDQLRENELDADRKATGHSRKADGAATGSRNSGSRKRK
jgi:circadian clock protein KaiC